MQWKINMKKITMGTAFVQELSGIILHGNRTLVRRIYDKEFFEEQQDKGQRVVCTIYACVSWVFAAGTAEIDEMWW